MQTTLTFEINIQQFIRNKKCWHTRYAVCWSMCCTWRSNQPQKAKLSLRDSAVLQIYC